jgi:HAE1 family hydrophobic/amphiphilic exporter-1
LPLQHARARRAVIGGLITSTLLTLLVVPVVCTYLDDLGALFVRWWSRKTPVRADISPDFSSIQPHP